MRLDIFISTENRLISAEHAYDDLYDFASLTDVMTPDQDSRFCEALKTIGTILDEVDDKISCDARDMQDLISLGEYHRKTTGAGQ